MTNARTRRIDHLILNTADLDALSAFYVDALGFTRERDDASGNARLRLGAQTIVLAPLTGGSAPYPSPMGSNDPWFQHFAIVVSDMAAAYDRVARDDHIPISRGGPQQLPPSTGNVCAYKFRDPEGHPLELSHIPQSAEWSLAATSNPGAVFLGIDHTAVAALALEASVQFYEALGFTAGPRFLNIGPEQDRLDGLDGVVLDIATMMAPGGGPHIELLHYRSPGAAAASTAIDGVAATRTIFTCEDGSEIALVLAERNLA